MNSMSAQKSPRRGIFTAIAGLLGFSVISGVLVTVMVAPALAVTGITASSTIGIFDALPEYITIGEQPQRNEIWATYTGAGNVNGYMQIATIYDQNREVVSYDQISPYALAAAVDGEDRRFFDHGGVDVPSVVRAAIGNAAGTSASGASTLSMQLVKNIFVQQALEQPTDALRQAAYADATATTLDRKLKEMKLAIGLEKAYTKKEILTAYLNIANFGNATYGIQAAAQRYYSVNAIDLTPEQAASLIAIVQYPNQRNLGDPANYSANQDRRDVILASMLQAGDITQEQHDEAVAIPVDDTSVKPSPPSSGCVAANQYARWFCDYVVKSVKDFAFLGATETDREANWKQGGYKLYTTLDMDIQPAAQNAIWTYAPNTETSFSLGSAADTVQPGTGRVLVMAENKIFNDTLEGGGPTASAVNYNTTFDYGGSTGFQPGSTYKVFTLLDWLTAGKGVNVQVSGNGDPAAQAALFHDRCNGPYTGTFFYKNNSNEDGIYTIRQGTVGSINGVFFSMAKQLDLCDIRDIAANLGVQRGDGAPLETNPTSIIGTNTVSPLSMAVAYAGIAANGLTCAPIIVDTVTLPTGETVPGQPKNCHQAVAPNIVDTAIDVLKGVMTSGNQVYSNPFDGIPIFGKTGTTDGANQTWMTTGTTSGATVVWVGNSIGDYNILDSEYADVPGILLRHYIMKPIVTALDNKYGGGDWPGPDPALEGGSATTVPDGLVGIAPESAKALLEGLGFTYADGGPVDSEQPLGKVASVNPPSGTPSGLGAVITVYTSKANKIALPDEVLDGKTKDFATAKSDFIAAGFTNVTQGCVVLTATPGPVLPTDPRIGKVQSTNPAPGSFQVPGATVAITANVGQITCP